MTRACHTGLRVSAFLAPCKPEIGSWSAWEGEVLLGCGALQEARYGFQQCPPFADYVEAPFSVCMCLDLAT